MFVGLVQEPRELRMSSYVFTKQTGPHPTGSVRGDVGRKRNVKRLMRRNELFFSRLSLHPSLYFLVYLLCFLFAPLLLVSSELSTSHCRSSEQARSLHLAGCSCVSSADTGSAAGLQSPSPPARPSWCPGWIHPLEAAGVQHQIIQ